MLRHALGGLVAAASLGLGGCSDYLERRDTIWLGAGEAVQTNIITHQIDPWPNHARRIRVASDGERAQRAIERYRNPRAGAGAGAGLGGDGAPPSSPGAAAAAPRAP